MKKFTAALLAALIVMSAGCTNSTPSDSTSESQSSVTNSLPEEEQPSTSDTTSETAPEPDYSSLSPEEIYDLMVQNSLITTGDTARMANVLKKAENGEEITIAFIGGSITYGMTVAPAEPEKCWAYLTYSYLCEKYPQAKINYVNAGISGTPSILGNARLERDVLAYKPDICFVEFAVNDGTGTDYKNSYESLVRTLLADENDIAVVLFFTIIESGHTCQPHMSQIGENYNLPMISEPNSLWKEITEGRMTWADYSDDQSHPNEYGHKLVSDFMKYYFEQVCAEAENAPAVDKTLPEPVFTDKYQTMHFIDSEKLEVTELNGFKPDNVHEYFNNGWSYKGETGASIKFSITCKTLELIYKENNSKIYADADIYVDGEKRMTVSSNSPDGWANPATAFIIDSDEVAEHEVEIVVPEGQKGYFAVLGFGYCD